MKRKQFILSGACLSAAFILPSTGSSQKTIKSITADNPKLDADLVKDFVTNCHGNFDKVKELYQKEPLLIFSSHDWGNGDFENGIEAAGHTGHKEIASFLLEKGARINFFTMCMLGKYEAVSQMLKEFPYLLNAKGPHGLTPLHHANQGKEDSLKIKELLESLGAKETQVKL